jgi:hypothetical protein
VHRGGAALVTATALLVPAVAIACPLCFSATDERVLNAYYLTAAGLTLLPLLIVGIFASWLHRRLGGGAPPRSAAFDPPDAGRDPVRSLEGVAAGRPRGVSPHSLHA